MFKFSKRHSRPADAQPIWAACSRLLDYPDQDLLNSLDQIQELVSEDEHLTPLIGHLRGNDLQTLQQEYVETFDHTRRCALYLTYFAYGDTRRRGVALVLL